MFYLGIDIGKLHHSAALIDSDGKKVAELPSFPAQITGFQQLLSFVNNELPAEAELLVGIEATGPYWNSLAHWLTVRDFSVVILNPLKVSALRNYGVRGSKTDPIDALLIAQAVRWEQAHPSTPLPKHVVELRWLTRLRTQLVKERTRAALRMGSLLSYIFPEFPSLFPKLASPSALAVLLAAPTPTDIISLGEVRLTKVLRAASRGRLGVARAQALIALASDSVGVATPALAQALLLLLAQVQLFSEQIRCLDSQIGEIYQKAQLPLHSLPGTGPVLAATYLSEIGSISRFTSAKQIVAFSGIDPKLRQSGKFTGQVRMSKRGSPHLRHAIYLACLTAVRTDAYFKAIYERQLQRGKPRRRALGAVMNHFVHVLYAVWRDNRPYSPLTSA